MRSLFRQLDEMGKIWLSQNFQMRQFLYSEIGAAFGIPNVPDNADLAIHNGRMLCSEILEPLHEQFGPIVIRSGFRSSTLNEFGARKGLNCAQNSKNYAYHIWDHRDESGHLGAAACITIPRFINGQTEFETWQELAWWIDRNLNYNRLTFFKNDCAFNIGYHEKPRAEIFSRNPTPHWLKKLRN